MSSPYYGRPTTYRGVRMRSRLEAATAAAFDRYNVPWEYEPEALQGSTGQYLPDFTVIVDIVGAIPLNDPDFPDCHDIYWHKDELLYVEVKPTREKQLEVAHSGVLDPVLESGGTAVVIVPTLSTVMALGPNYREGKYGSCHRCFSCGGFYLGTSEKAFDDLGCYPDCHRCGAQLWLDEALLRTEYWKPAPKPLVPKPYSQGASPGARALGGFRGAAR